MFYYCLLYQVLSPTKLVNCLECCFEGLQLFDVIHVAFLSFVNLPIPEPMIISTVNGVIIITVNPRILLHGAKEIFRDYSLNSVFISRKLVISWNPMRKKNAITPWSNFEKNLLNYLKYYKL